MVEIGTLFRYYQSEKKIEKLDGSFDSSITEKIKKIKVSRKPKLRKLVYNYLKVAATVLIVITTSYFYRQSLAPEKRPELLVPTSRQQLRRRSKPLATCQFLPATLENSMTFDYSSLVSARNAFQTAHLYRNLWAVVKILAATAGYTKGSSNGSTPTSSAGFESNSCSISVGCGTGTSIGRTTGRFARIAITWIS